MATVLDRLVVELGLDPSKFTQGQREAMAAFKKAQEEADARRKKWEESANKSNQTFNALRNNALRLMAAFVGGYGLEQFIVNTTRADAALGRLAYRTGQGVQRLSAWGQAVEQLGGSADAFNATVEGLSNQINRFALTGEGGEFINWLQAIGVNMVDAAGKARKIEDIFLDISKAIQDRRIAPEQANVILREMGIDEGTINLLLKSREQIQAMLSEIERAGIVNKGAADQAQALATAFNAASQAATSLGRAMLNDVSPALTKALELMREGFIFAKANRFGIMDLFNPGAFIGRTISRSIGRRILGDTGASGTDEAGFGGEWWKTPAKTSGGLRLKRGEGTQGASAGAVALAQVLQDSFPEINRFTAFNDAHHGGRGKHGAGLAFDFSLKDNAQAAQVSAAIRAKLASLGIAGTVLDEVNNPSAGATGPHIHVSFANAAEAARFAELARTGGAGGGGSNNNTTNIGTLNVVTQATDAEGIAKAIPGAISRNNPAVIQAAGGAS